LNGAPLTLRLYERPTRTPPSNCGGGPGKQHYPQIDFAARVAWWRERWRSELVPVGPIMLGRADGALVGFVTVDPKTRYLGPDRGRAEAWGSEVAAALVAEARRISPDGLDLKVNADNARAIGSMKSMAFRPAVARK